MTVSTALPGRPEDVHSLAAWLRTSLAPGLNDVAGALRSATALAETGWEGDAGDAFRTRATSTGRSTEELAGTVADAARAVDGWAVALSTAQAELRHIRETAAEAGLTVVGEDVLAPAGVPDPADVLGRERWDRLHRAYVQASESARAVDRQLHEFDRTTLQNMGNDIRSKPLLLAADFVGAGAGGAVVFQTAQLTGEADRLRSQAAEFEERMRTAPPGTSRAVLERDQADADDFRRQARELDGRAARLTSGAGRWIGRASGPLAVAGVAWDIAHGKPADQAIVSGAAGFGASVLAGMAAGAVAGSLIPVPGVGTALGALVGAGAGLFASGAVDSLYEHGLPEIDRALADGAAAVGETGAAIGELATEAWNALF